MYLYKNWRNLYLIFLSFHLIVTRFTTWTCSYMFVHSLLKILIFRIAFKYLYKREKSCWGDKECFCFELFNNAIIGIYLWWWILAKGKRRHILYVVHNFLVHTSCNIDERYAFCDDEIKYSISFNRRKIFLY